jgi:Beta-ketoacyl synthase, N-terminal domain
MTNEDSIRIDGCGLVTPAAAGSARDVLATPPADSLPPGATYHAIPEAFLDRYPDFSPELKRDRGAWITAAATVHAIEDAGVDLADFEPERIALVLGSAFAGQLGMIQFAEEVREKSPRFVSPIHFPQTVGNYVAGAIARAFKIRGPNSTVATGATSGMSAIVTACGLLADGAADIALAGGMEILSPELVRGLSQPSGAGGAGDDHPMAWSEGACIYVLRRAESDATSANYGLIQEYTASAPPDTARWTDSCVATRVGQSLAAESAARVAVACVARPSPAAVYAREAGTSPGVVIISSPS